MKFKSRIMVRSVLIAIIPILLSFIIITKLRVRDINENIKRDLKEISFVVSHTPLVQEVLSEKRNDFTIQNHVKEYTNNFENVDIIVIGDMDGIKYSHLDEKQIGKQYVNTDNREVIRSGKSYYSTMRGSMGVTVRYFSPIYYNGKQVGFVMVGKYQKEVRAIQMSTLGVYLILLVFVMIITIILSETLARKIKKEMLGMEPEEIARLYKEKKIILDTIDEGVIAIDADHKIIEINNNCEELCKNFNVEDFFNKIMPYIERLQSIKMKEFSISGEKLFINLNFIEDKGRYLGAVITFVRSEKINRVAREITGIDGLLKNIRANVHEFKNKLHVILGLINIEEYEEAKKYISECQKEVNDNSMKVANINDTLISAMLLSKKLIAKEKNIEFLIDKKSYLREKHENIESVDIITILGNLIENAFDACTGVNDARVILLINETDTEITIEVSDNGIKIEESIKDNLFKNGVSSKGEGRGIGLSTVKGRVELYNGTINIKETRKNKKFKIIIKKEGKDEEYSDS